MSENKTDNNEHLAKAWTQLVEGVSDELHWREILNYVPALVSVVDQTGKVLFVSQHHTVLASVPESIASIKTEQELYPDSVLKRFTSLPSQITLAHGEQEWEMSAQHRDGIMHHYRMVQRVLNINSDNKLVITIGWEVLQNPPPDPDQKSSYNAYHDPVTGLANRTLFYDRVQRSLARTKRSHNNLALMLIDLDRFRSLNDSLGRDAGDLFLRLTAGRLIETLRDTDTVARLGSDEFVLILENITNARDLESVAEKILQNLSQPLMINDQEIALTCSIGVSLFPKDGDTIDQLMKHADLAMYRAKSSGKNRWQFFLKAMTENAVNYLLLENDLRRAIENNELLLHYQPQIDLRDGKIVGVEALVRWQHHERGLVSPVEFIPLAEETGLIEPLGRWVLHHACETFQRWLIKGLNFGKVAVNLSTRQFRQERFEQSVKEVLALTRLAPQYLELEITESSAMENAAESINMLKNLNRMGLSLAIDDFGTGYSSLSYLKRFPIQKLKIDRSFINDIDSNNADAAIAKSIIDLAHNMTLQVVAEGVERSTQSRWLVDRGCDQVQGFYFSRPLSEEDLLALVSDPQKAVCDPTGIRLLL